MKLPVLFLCSLCAGFCLTAHARDLAAYRVGDVADADVITPVALDVADPAATAALQLARATQFPAVFRSLPSLTNTIAVEFLAAFAQAQTNFLAELFNQFHSSKLDENTIASEDFSRLVTAFGVKNKNFPASEELAAAWAGGGDGQVIREQVLSALLRAEGRLIRPDVLPKGMVVGETVRLVPVAGADQKLSLSAVQAGRLVPAGALVTLSEAQTEFRRAFPAPQQLFARALANSVKPNFLPDAPFTQLTRGTEVCQLIVANHFDAGDVLARRGDTIDAKALAAIAALDQKLREPVAPDARPPVVAATPEPKAPPPPPPPPTLETAVQRPAPMPARGRAQPGLRHEDLILTLAAVSFLALLVAAWQFRKERKHAAASATSIQAPLPFPDVSHSVTPQVTQAVREAVQQELAHQRRELLVTQQAATDDIAALVQRLDELQMPMQERLHAYETRIRELEKELALRNAENRELLKLKIEMTRRQMETEHATTLMTATAG